MPDVHQVTAIIANPDPNDPSDTGRVTLGYYVLEDNLLTMTDGEGVPFRGRGGDRISHRLQSDEDPTVIAKRLTMKIYRMVRGGDMAGFNRPLNYQPSGIA